MKKLLLLAIMTLCTLPAFAQDPKETPEFWRNGKNFNEAKEWSKKCWNSSQTFFKVKEDSKEWRICCAIYKAYNPNHGTLEQISEGMKQAKREWIEMNK